MTDNAAVFIDPEDIPEDERLEIRYVPLEDICTEYNNPNAMTEKEFLSLVESIRAIGFVQPCVIVPTEATEVATELPFVMVDGFHRWKALAVLDRTACPVVVAESLDHAMVIIARIALNKNRGNLNLTAVATELHALSGEGLDLETLCVTGYTEDEIGKMLEAMSTDVDDTMSSQLGVTSIAADIEEESASPRPFLLEIQFATKDQRNAVRKALKTAGNGDITVGLLAIAGVED